jgi:hypothetical protein
VRWAVATVKTIREVHASVGATWDVIADLRTEPKYWTNLRDIKVIKESAYAVEREATIGPSSFGQKTRQTIVFDPKRSIKLTITGASIEGERTLVLVPLGKNNTRVEATWDFALSKAPWFVQDMVRDQISVVTEEALAKIAEDAERAGGSTTN